MSGEIATHDRRATGCVTKHHRKLTSYDRDAAVEALRLHGTIKGAAYSLGITPSTLFNRMKKFGIARPPKLSGPPWKPIPRPKNFTPIECPGCQRSTNVPPLDVVINHYKLPPVEERILRTLWAGRGHPVKTEPIFDAIYADDPDGGPSPDAMYRELRKSFGRLLTRIEGSGISIEAAGYRRGFRLVIGDGSRCATL